MYGFVNLKSLILACQPKCNEGWLVNQRKQIMKASRTLREAVLPLGFLWFKQQLSHKFFDKVDYYLCTRKLELSTYCTRRLRHSFSACLRRIFVDNTSLVPGWIGQPTWRPGATEFSLFCLQNEKPCSCREHFCPIDVQRGLFRNSTHIFYDAGYLEIHWL